ncbi:MAG: N(4)-(beta-N-acetylglucosaminyl)-L-asparaginase [Planctomycetes bacterium]|nr:N(4)-(beta-N-acetylglucosaminyl)-L-asparaginase [Planctomycetota bacterium]MCB9889250.1 N(4)-(beta-N-acetylglucosaminyl)-L-asparaginase [Planctomycetota bacterium]
MDHPVSRRRFLRMTTASLPCLASTPLTVPHFNIPPRRRVKPAAVGSLNSLKTLHLAAELMAKGVPPVDAAVAVINPVEDDPKDMSVGYGGLPNERGEVELDSCVMDGPSGLAGAVAALRRIKNPSKVALQVMRRTDHVLLVGAGALEFARAHGFPEQNLLTEAARKQWLKWKENLSTHDDWVSPAEGQGERKRMPRPPGTIHVSAINSAGDLGACTSTSGLAYKIPGRVGDSPLIGCGLYTDNDYGSAGSTGRGEAVILSNGSAFIVHQMALGKSPTDACLEACKRIVRLNKSPRLRDANGRPTFNVNFYAVDKKGVTGGASIYPSRYAALGENGVEAKATAHLF